MFALFWWIRPTTKWLLGTMPFKFSRSSESRGKWKLDFMVTLAAFIVLLCLLQLSLAAPPRSRKCRSVNNDEMEEMIKRLGMAQLINRRYLSTSPPPQLLGKDPGDSDFQSDQDPFQDFLVDENYEAPIGSKSFHMDFSLGRSKRQTDEDDTESSATWNCDRTTEWEDLGENYYPRYLRKVKCLCERCWFTHYKCVPRSFTIIILRRIEKKCSYGKPSSTEKEWEFVEKAVPVFCECVRN